MTTALVDLDGVVWLSGEPIGQPERAVAELRRDHRVVFVTNNAASSRGTLLERLGRVGLELDDVDLVTPGSVIASLLPSGARVLSLAGPGVDEAVRAAGAELVSEGPCEFVVVGLTERFDANSLAAASLAIRGGARFLATNLDPTHPTPAGLMPGSGAIVAAVATASESEPEVCGKPAAAMLRFLEREVGAVAVVVGDRASTDGALAASLGAEFLLVDAGTEQAHGVQVAARGGTLEDVVDLWRKARG